MSKRKLKDKTIKVLRKKYNLPILSAFAGNYYYYLHLDDGRVIEADRFTDVLKNPLNKWSVDDYKQNMSLDELNAWEIEKLNYNYDALEDIPISTYKTSSICEIINIPNKGKMISQCSICGSGIYEKDEIFNKIFSTPTTYPEDLFFCSECWDKHGEEINQIFVQQIRLISRVKQKFLKKIHSKFTEIRNRK